jgi:hypothetical protein
VRDALRQRVLAEFVRSAVGESAVRWRYLVRMQDMRLARRQGEHIGCP